MNLRTILSLTGIVLVSACLSAGTIDRHALVSRHNIITDRTINKSPAQVGNGSFAFGMDITGLQTFTPFNTLSDWAWHSMPLPEGKSIGDYSPTVYESYGKKIAYMLADKDEPELSQWLRKNPHRFNLGRIGFVLLREDGTAAAEKDLLGTRQETDLWTGIVSSSFILEGKSVNVRTSCHPEMDIVGVVVESELIEKWRLKIFIDFPYADLNEFPAYVGDYLSDEKHTSKISRKNYNGAVIDREMDDAGYSLQMSWNGKAEIVRETPQNHRYIITPEKGRSFNFTCRFVHDKTAVSCIATSEIETASSKAWEKYWTSGAAVDFSESKDIRWKELERRVVLSQYLMKVNECGLLPPQESGLVNNGWFGRFHFEMVWWHVVHYALWGRMDCFNSYMGTYKDFMPEAIKRAGSEGRSGAKWPKCTGNINQEWPNDVHAFLIWQQPHPIYFAELDYRSNPDKAVLKKWKDIVIATADYMADCVFWNKDKKRYVIGPPVVPVSENTDPYATMNPAFEVEYFRYALTKAIEWGKRMGLTRRRTAKWRDVLQNLSEIPQQEGLYVTYEGIPDMWTKFNFEHPALTGIYGWLPGYGVDKEVFSKTFDTVLEKWQMNKVWGWDYPMLAMAAARLGRPEQAVDLLCTTAHKFGFDAHGLAQSWPFPYFPANGGLLTAIAMMCEGWDGSEGEAPGFPKDGSWTIRYEGFNKME